MESVKTIQVLLAEDHAVTRMGIKMFVEQMDDVKIVGEAADGAECVDLAAKLKPHIVLMDVEMPVMDGIQASRKIRETLPDCKVIMMTSHKDEKDIFASLAAGASGYCLKNATDDRLYAAILSVARGDMWLDSTIAATVLNALPRPSLSSAKKDDADTLSEREIEVLQLIVEGLPNNKIADRLFISTDTVKSHIKHIMEKLSVNDRTQAAVKAIRAGLI